MAQALDPTAYIYEGFWRNMGKDSSRSLTLTLSPTNATLLTNALALFVAMSGGQLWTIIRFTLHQIRASSKSERFDMTHTQQQIVLRNATTDIATARLMLNLAWASRENAKKAIGTCVTIIILAILNATLFMAAGTFSNTLVDAGPEVLSRSPHCGLWNQTYLDIVDEGPNPTSETNYKLSVGYLAKQIRDVQQSLEYAQNCYMSRPSEYWASTCGTLQAPQLNWTTLYNASCPFGTEVCSDLSPTIVLDTGVMDTHIDLGINAQPSDRLGYRRVTNCTVLNDTGHVTDFIQQNDSSSRLYANYGPSNLEFTDFTYSYSNFAEYYTNYTGISTAVYQLNAQAAFAENAILPVQPSFSTFEPIPALTRSEADTLLFFLSFTGKYTGPVKDPWFSANKEAHRDSPLPLVQTNFARDRPISTLGCTEQHQLCASQGHCTDLAGFDQAQQNLVTDFKLTTNQHVTLNRLMNAGALASMYYVIENIAQSNVPILAVNLSATEATTLSLPVPDHQWQLEVSYWHSIAMAQLQRTLIEYGTGQIAPDPSFLVPVTGADAWFCRNIMIRSTVFSSFDVVPLALLISFGTLIIVLSLTIERSSSWLQRRWNRGHYGRRMWEDHDMLGFQLKRGRGQSLPSSNGSVPIGQQQIFDRGVQLGIMSPAASRYYPSGLPSGSSPTRASSKALSPADYARMFPSPPLGSNSSPARSAVTADFVFDWGPQADAKIDPASSTTKNPEKTLPEVPPGKKEFCIDRGTTYAQSDSSQSVKCTDELVNKAPSEKEEPPAFYHSEAQDHVHNLPSMGPGRWAYYSAHKRRYGPKLTVPTPHITMATPHLAMPSRAGLRGRFEDRSQGNWI